MSLIVKGFRIIREEGWRVFVEKAFRYIVGKLRLCCYYLLAPVIAYRFHVVSGELKSIGDVVDFSFGFSFLGVSVNPAQVRDEIYGLCKLIYDIKPKVILEIGTANGGTLFLWSRVANDDAIIISIDLSGGRFGGGYPEWRIPLYESFVIHKQKIHLVREDSHTLATLNIIKKILEGRKLDFLFIDGDHTYNGVKTDFEMYGRLVRKGGIIAFHDVCPHPPQTGCEVNKFWCEIKDGYEHIEVVRDWKQGWAGIGVLHV